MFKESLMGLIIFMVFIKVFEFFFYLLLVFGYKNMLKFNVEIMVNLLII